MESAGRFLLYFSALVDDLLGRKRTWIVVRSRGRKDAGFIAAHRVGSLLIRRKVRDQGLYPVQAALVEEGDGMETIDVGFGHLEEVLVGAVHRDQALVGIPLAEELYHVLVPGEFVGTEGAVADFSGEGVAFPGSAGQAAVIEEIVLEDDALGLGPGEQVDDEVLISGIETRKIALVARGIHYAPRGEGWLPFRLPAEIPGEEADSVYPVVSEHIEVGVPFRQRITPRFAVAFHTAAYQEPGLAVIEEVPGIGGIQA